jgi:hypothetical protein
MKPKFVWYVNYKKRPSTRKPKRMWMSAYKSFYSEQEALQWMKENNLKFDRWTHIEKCELDYTLLAGIFSI